MVRLLLLLFFTFAFITVQSQALTLTPSTAHATVESGDTDVAAKATLKNNAEETKEFIWKRNIKSITQGWETAVCDFNLCYNPNIDSMNITLSAGEESNMDIHVYPNGVEGSAEVELTVYEVGADTNSVEGSYLFNMTTPVRKIKLDQVKVFPNPASEYFQVESTGTIAKIEVYHLSLKKVKTFYAYQNKSYYIGDLSDGVYFLKLYDYNNNHLKSLKLNKR